MACKFWVLFPKTRKKTEKVVRQTRIKTKGKKSTPNINNNILPHTNKSTKLKTEYTGFLLVISKIAHNRQRLDNKKNIIIIKILPKKGLEPITFGFGDQCSTIELPSLKGNNQT